MEKIIPLVFQVLGEELGVGQRSVLVQAKIVRRPTPPADRCWGGCPGMMQATNQVTIGLKQGVVITAKTEHDALGGKMFSRADRQAQLDPVLRPRVGQRVFLGEFGRAGRINFVTNAVGLFRVYP